MTETFSALRAAIQEAHPRVVFDIPDKKGAALEAWEVYVNVPADHSKVRVLGLVLRHLCTLKLYPDHFALLPGDLVRSACGITQRTNFELADPEKFDALLDIIASATAF